MLQPIQPHGPIYDQELNGFYGAFGTGANAKIVYLQSAIEPRDLHKISLISDIKGAEKWSVRDLFQRDVDVDRVTKGLIPYFKDEGKVKFFNPITLTLLPVNENGDVLQEIPSIVESRSIIEGVEYLIFEAEGLFQFKIPIFHEQPSYSQSSLDWNSSRIKIVAIDGQHRLSALKRFQNDDDNGDFGSWNIPVVLFSVRKIDENIVGGSLFDVIRNIFIYINTQAKTPNRARQILLSDESINSVCTQEILEYSHSNDVNFNELNRNKIPLVFYDWRGEERNGQRVPGPGSMKQIEEVHDWLEEYICGKDFSVTQKDALDIGPDSELSIFFTTQANNRTIPVELIQKVRGRFNDDLLIGFVHLMENFSPYARYIEFIRNLEDGYEDDYDLAKHAFHKLRFGSHYGGNAEIQQIDEIYSHIIQDIMDYKDDPESFPGLVDMDIGMRGVIFAYSRLRKFYSSLVNESVSWEKYSIWFTKVLNDAYNNDGWLKNKAHKLLRHITYSHGGTTVNYRFKDVEKGLGALLIVILSKYGVKRHGDDFSLSDDRLNEEWLRLYNDYVDTIAFTLEKGYKRECKVLLNDEYPQGGTELTKAVNKAANREVDRHVARLTNYLTNIS